ncbi:MAG: hypothetical protein KAQ64_03385 [Candidatus Pacebacteria bacterium]|nr:hypothetical protein [Candidatus Paceibacterota bacterium]
MNLNRGLLLIIAGIMILSLIIALVLTTPEVPELITEDGLPEGYHLSWSENKQDVTISCFVAIGKNPWEDKLNFSLGVGEIWLGQERSYFVLDGNALPMTKRNGNISTLCLYEIKDSVLITWNVILYENKEWDSVWDLSWKAKMEPGEKIILPTGEELTFWRHSPHTGNPLLSITTE